MKINEQKLSVFQRHPVLEGQITWSRRKRKSDPVVEGCALPKDQLGRRVIYTRRYFPNQEELLVSLADKII